MEIFENLVIFEMANNHMGNVKFGLKIIEEFANLKDNYSEISDLKFAFKFQFRDIDTFIHSDPSKYVIDSKSQSYIERFKDTKLSKEDFIKMKTYAEELGFLTICTAFDEKSVDLIEELKFDAIKIGSCSFNDWPLLNKIAEKDLPIIASTATYELEEIDKVVSFFLNRNKKLALMHCVGEYPTEYYNLNLGRIDILKQRYDIPIGFSSHEKVYSDIGSLIAVSKGSTIFERHVTLDSELYKRNTYSINYNEAEAWVWEIIKGFNSCKSKKFSTKEISDIRQFKRGVFAKNDIKKGEKIDRSNVYYAWPNIENQLVANDMSKYVYYLAKEDISKDDPIFPGIKVDDREQIWNIVQDIKKLIIKSGIIVPKNATLEISHHLGLDYFYKTGLTMITVVNNDYCKKYLIMLPNQHHPPQYHNFKEETFSILYGGLYFGLDETTSVLEPGDVITIKPTQIHSFTALEEGCIIEEISSTHYKNDSFYINEDINQNKDRKTFINYWL